MSSMAAIVLRSFPLLIRSGSFVNRICVLVTDVQQRLQECPNAWKFLDAWRHVRPRYVADEELTHDLYVILDGDHVVYGGKSWNHADRFKNHIEHPQGVADKVAWTKERGSLATVKRVARCPKWDVDNAEQRLISILFCLGTPMQHQGGGDVEAGATYELTKNFLDVGTHEATIRWTDITPSHEFSMFGTTEFGQHFFYKLPLHQPKWEQRNHARFDRGSR